MLDFGWILFGFFVLLVLMLDLLVFHKKAHLVSFKEACIWSAIWVFLALLFSVYIYFAIGKESAINFLTGYLIEKSLSVDNLFIFLVIFNYFQTPESSYHKVLFWGVLGAIVIRAFFILTGVVLVQIFHPIIYFFGIFLVLTGIKLAVQQKQKLYLYTEKNFFIRLGRRLLPLSQEYEGDRFFVVKHSKLFATPLFLVLLAIEFTDIVFAVDSIPAILAITLDPFVIFTSNIFAILGLRALFFVLVGSLKLFHYLHYGISAILVFVGLKMLLSDIVRIVPILALGIIFSILFFSILASVVLKKH